MQMSKQEIIKRISAIGARELEVRAMMICAAEDPVKMIELLKPRIADAKGEINPLYYSLAQAELHRRAATQRIQTH